MDSKSTFEGVLDAWQQIHEDTYDVVLRVGAETLILTPDQATELRDKLDDAAAEPTHCEAIAHPRTFWLPAEGCDWYATDGETCPRHAEYWDEP